MRRCRWGGMSKSSGWTRRTALLGGALLLLVACTSTRSIPKGGANAETTSIPATPVSVLGGLSPAAPMGVARAAHTATRLQDGRVLIAGGFGDDGSEASAELFDPADGSFSPTGAMSTARNSQTATLLRDGRVLLVGGYGAGGERLASAELYDPTAGSFSPTGSMPSRRADHTATLLRDGRVLIVGGTGAGYSFLASALLYDPVDGIFSSTGSMSVRRESATATPLPDDRVLIAGGHAGRHESIQIYASAEVYDVATGMFSSVGDMTIPRHKHDAVPFKDGRVLIVGGSDERDDQGLYRMAEIFDPLIDTFYSAGRLHDGRYKMRGTSVRLADGRLLVCCGASRAELFDPSSGVFQRIAGSFGAGPLFAAAVRIGPEELLVTGGYSLTSPATDATWIIQL